VRLALCSIVAIGLAASLVRAQAAQDGAIVNAMKQSDREVAAVKIWRRVPLDGALDIVFAMGGRHAGDLIVNRDESALWFPKLGLFLQERSNPGRVYTLTIAPGHGCGANIIRVTTTDAVISCEGEKSEVEPNQKFVYDIRAKRLVSRVEYMPFGHVRITPTAPDRARLTMSSSTREVQLSFSAGAAPELRIIRTTPLPTEVDYQTHFLDRFGPAIRFPSQPFGPSGAFRLTELDEETGCAQQVVVVSERGARRQHYRMPRARPPADCDQIGPSAIEGNQVWFGKTFYSGEGYDGIGGFGYFEMSTRRFELFSLPPAAAPGAATAILVQPDAIWLALALHGEGDSRGRGLLRYDRRLRTTTHFDIGDSLGHSFVAFRDRIALTLDDGVVFIRDGQVKGYIVDQMTDGRLRVAEAFN
jgi:hypothetical protein